MGGDTWTFPDGSQPPDVQGAPSAESAAESVPSRPSMANCADSDSGGIDGATADSGRDKRAAIEGIVDSCRASFGELANRAVSLVPEHRLREECTREIRGGEGGFKSRVVTGVLKAYLRWLAEQEDSSMVYLDPDGEEVTGPLEHAYDESYIGKKYGVVKDGERAFVRDADSPHTAMVTLTGSNLNARGDPRCPGDHLVDLKASWEYVRRELQRAMDDFDRYDPDDPPERWWEYAVVVEPHKSGYAHMHVAVFASAEIEAERFAPVLEKHVEKCDMAGSDAHQVVPDDPSESAVSVNAVDPGAEYDPESDEMQDISNLGSYIAEYLGAAGEELWERPVSELICYATLWATGTRRMHFSQGFHKLADEGMKIRGGDTHEPSGEWSLKGIEDSDGQVHEVHQGKVCHGCGLKETGLETDVCPDCGALLRSAAADYMTEIRGIPGGDPAPVRE